MRSRQLAIFLLLAVAFAANEVSLVQRDVYYMGIGQFTGGAVSYVSTDDVEQHFVASDLTSLRFYANNNGAYNNTTAYFVNFANKISQMRFRGDGVWLAVRDDTNSVIYFMKQNGSGVYYTDHNVSVGSYPNSFGWTYNEDYLAVGLANNSISVLKRNTSSNTFYVYQIINTSHTGGVSKVFGKRARIYSSGGSDSVLQSWWLNITTGVWSLNQTLNGVGAANISAMYVSSNEKRIIIGRSNGDLVLLDHSNNSFIWYVQNNLTGAHAGSVNFVRVDDVAWNLVSGAANDPNVELRTRYNNWATPINYTLNGQSGDWDGVNQQFTIGTYGNNDGTFYTESLTANCTAGTVNSSDPTRCTCPSGQVWLRGGCNTVNCNSTNFTNFAGGFNTSDNNLSCNCNPGYKWNEGFTICTIDCTSSAFPNSTGTNFEFLSCECNAGYQWDYTLVACVRYQNCNGVANSNGSNAASNACFCNSGYVWNSSWNSTNGGACQRNCSLYTHASAISSTDPTICACANGYSWNNGSTTCVLDCSAVTYAKGTVNSTVCKCQSNYRWDTAIGQCVSSGSSSAAVPIALGIAIPLGVLGILGLAALIWWLSLPKPLPIGPPPVFAPSPQVLYPTSQVTQVVPQSNGSLTRLVQPPSYLGPRPY